MVNNVNTELLYVKNVGKKFIKNSRDFNALIDVTFKIKKSEVLGIVGGSGSGKSTLAKLIMGIEKPDSGEIYYKGLNINNLNEEEKRDVRHNIQMVYQDTFSSLNPRMKISDIVAEPLDINLNLSKSERKDRILELLNDVNISEEKYNKFPHECSGGERQRIAIARAISLNPELIICDEAVSSLDMSIKDQILELLKKLQREHSITYIFISHDLAVVRKISDNILIIDQGQIVEFGNTEEIYKAPQSSITKGLLSNIRKF